MINLCTYKHLELYLAHGKHCVCCLFNSVLIIIITECAIPVLTETLLLGVFSTDQA